ncbi:MAG: hypothetical protein IPG04_15475 [Polyangiaceae bacterium]|nr:hypothetical protein [Polyangiaceae bacterium]
MKLHMERLEALEYLVPYRMRGPLVVYELAYAAGADLGTTGPWSGSAGAMSGSAGAMSGGDRAMIPRMSGDDRGVERAPNSLKKAANGASSYSRSEFTLQVPGRRGRRRSRTRRSDEQEDDDEECEAEEGAEAGAEGVGAEHG